MCLTGCLSVAKGGETSFFSVDSVLNSISKEIKPFNWIHCNIKILRTNIRNTIVFQFHISPMGLWHEVTLW